MTELQATPTTYRKYLIFWMGQLGSLLGSSIAQFVIIWWITLETGSALYLALASLAGLGPQIVLAPIAGAIVDRSSRKMLIGTVDFLQALATIVLIVLFWTGSPSFWYIFALLLLRGSFQAFHEPATQAIIPLMVPHDKLSRLNGLTYLFNGLVRLIAPVLAAILLDIWKIPQILWIDVITFILALIPLILITIPSVRSEQEQTSFKKDFVDGFIFIKNARGLLPLIILSTILNFTITPLSTLLPYFIRFDHLGDITDLALVTAALQGGILAGGLVMSVIKGVNQKMKVAGICIYLLYLGYILVALTPTGLFWFMSLSAFFLAFWLPIANVLSQTIFQTAVPPEMLGRVSSVLMALSMAATPMGMVVAGTVVEFTATVNLFLGCIGLGVLALTVFWLFTDIRDIEELGKTWNTSNE